MISRPNIQFFTTAGDGTGSPNMAVNGSETPAVFKIAIPSGFTRFNVHRLIWHIEDDADFDGTKFGASVVMTTGLTLVYKTLGGNIDLCGGQKIKTNNHLARLVYNIRPIVWGAGGTTLVARLNFDAIEGEPLELHDNGTVSESLELTVSDDLRALVDFTLTAEGVIS